MKRILSLFLALTALLAVCLSLVSCSIESKYEIQYGKKYIYEYSNLPNGYETREVLIFNKDGTGTYEYYYRKDTYDNEYDYTKSGTLSFIWEKTSDGAIHMIETGVKYNEDNTDGYKIVAISIPMYYSENLIYYSSVSGASGYSSTRIQKYFLEGSDLYEETYN